MFSTPPLFQTEPDGRPADDVGTLIIDRLFTNVVQTLSVVICVPTINEQAHDAVFPHPPKTPA
jgi:hypothetical protein